MSGISTECEEINKLVFEPLTAEIRKVTKIMKNKGCIVAVGENGTIYTNVIPAKAFYYGLSDRAGSVVEALIKMKVLTKPTTEKYLKEQENRQVNAVRLARLDLMHTYATMLGFEFTPEQLKKFPAPKAMK